MINKIIQYLSLKDQKKNFRIYNKSDFRENEPVIFDAELYNESYELINEPEADITIRNEDAKEFPYVFNKSGNAYHLDAGTFPPGNYSYQAQATLGSNIYNANGQFSVSAIDLEALNTVETTISCSSSPMAAVVKWFIHQALTSWLKTFLPGKISGRNRAGYGKLLIRAIMLTSRAYANSCAANDGGVYTKP